MNKIADMPVNERPYEKCIEKGPAFLSACTKAIHKLDFSRPDTIARYYMESMRHKEKEELVVAYLDTKCQMIKDMMITSGTINQSLFSIREIFVQALRFNAVNIVIVHNHPSGNSEPSKDDIISTKKYVKPDS